MTPDLDTFLKVAEILSILGGGGLVAVRLTRSTMRVENIITLQGEQISTLKDEIKMLSKLVTEVAVQSTRLDSQDKRLDMVDRTIDLLRRGEGFIFTLEDHLRGLNRKS